jgi:hypothetical protein
MVVQNAFEEGTMSLFGPKQDPYASSVFQEPLDEWEQPEASYPHEHVDEELYITASYVSPHTGKVVRRQIKMTNAVYTQIASKWRRK